MLSTFIKLPFVIKIFVLSIFERPFYTGFTVVEDTMSNLQNFTERLGARSRKLPFCHFYQFAYLRPLDS